MLFSESSVPKAGFEEFRTLRSRLLLFRRNRPLKTVVITSSLPLEGKTFVSANLAQVIALQKEHRVLLIDGDLRKPRLHEVLGAPRSPGLSDLLADGIGESQSLQGGPVTNLYFIPSGRHVPNPSELIGNGRLPRMLQDLSPLFEWIIIDTPPVIPVSDVKLIGQSCDGLLIVVKSGATPFDLAQRACRELKDLHPLGVVLNRVELLPTYESYYYKSKGDDKEK